MLSRMFIVVLTLCPTLLLSFAIAQPQDGATPPELAVRVDPRVELLSIVFCYAGNPEYNMGRVDKYLKAIDKHFDEYRDHPVIERAATLRRDYGVSYDAVMSMAVHLDDTRSLSPRIDINAEWCTLDSRWRRDEAQAFLKLLRDFVHESDFNGFFESQRPLYDITESRMRELLREQADLAWFEEFHGSAPTAPFTVCIGLANGGGNYGPKVVREDGSEELFAIMGVWQADFNGDPIFAGVISTLVHEFNHSFINHLVAAREAELREAGEEMFRHVERGMRRQAYGEWQTMMFESLVRAATIRYTLAHQGEEAATVETAEQVERSFFWMPELVELLAEYEASRDEYPTLDSFMPRVVEFMNEAAPKVEEQNAKRDADHAAGRPTLVSMQPENHAVNVDPATSRIILTFDRPMGNGYMVNYLDDAERAHFPKVIKAEWSDDHTVFTLHVMLKPGWEYRYALNSASGGSFRSRADGTPLERIEVHFHTAAESDH